MTAVRGWAGAWLAALVLWIAGWWGAAAAEPYPAIQQDSFYAEDYAGILSADTKARIESVGRALEKKTKAQVAVVTVPDIPDGDIETYATGLFRERGFGDKKLNNGILLLVSVQDRKARVEVGYGLEGALNDAKAGRILDEELLPAFRDGDYDRGVLQAYTALVKVCMEEYQIESLDTGHGQKIKTDSTGLSFFEIVLIGAGLAVLILLDQLFLGGMLTNLLLQILFLFLSGRGGGGFGSRGGGGSSGGGGASRRW